MKRKRKAGGPHFSSMAWRIDRIAPQTKKPVFFRTLIAFIDGDIDKLPNGWVVSWGWRNAEDEDSWEHTDSFENTVNNSTSGFVDLMRQRLTQDLGAVLSANRKRPKRKQRKAKTTGKKTKRKNTKRRKVSRVPKRGKPRGKTKRKRRR